LSQEETVLEERLSREELKVVLQPHAIELISRKDFRRLLRDLENLGFPSDVDHIFDNARKIIYQTSFIAFLAGKNKAAKEARIQFWSVEENDMPLIKKLREKYFYDFDKIFRELITQIRLKDPEASKTLNRCDILLQMLTWQSYNKGKLALWDDEILKPRFFQAQAYKYEGVFMFKTAGDEDVCDLCAPLSGQLSEDPHEMEMPPLHAWCRCEIVAIPTVESVKGQERFLKKWWEEQQENE